MVPRQPVVVGTPEGRRLMRVLVTGAAGQLGTDVVATCTAGGDDVFDGRKTFPMRCGTPRLFPSLTGGVPSGVAPGGPKEI